MLPKRTQEKSFSLIETVVAMGLMVVTVLKISSIQGYSVQFSHYQKKLSQASWLAAGTMARIQYAQALYPLEELRLQEEDHFPNELCSRKPQLENDFRYKVEIFPWKLALIKLFLPQNENPALLQRIELIMKEAAGEPFLKIATVEVSWPEGAKKNQVQLSYLLTAQVTLDKNLKNLSLLSKF